MRGVLIGLFSVVMVAGASAELRAQAQVPYPVPATAKIAWNHEGATPERPLTGFSLEVVGSPAVDLGVPTPVNASVCGPAPKPLCEYQAPFPAVQPGTRTLQLRACNTVLCSDPASLTVAVIVVPVSPAQFRIVIGGE